jgi:hypothetical protein
MVIKPASSIYAIVEKAYYRLQAGDVLSHCMEDGSTDPIHVMIQEMVLAGPQSLDSLREVLEETLKRKAQVYDDLNQVTNQLSIILKGYGLNLEKHENNKVMHLLNENELYGMFDEESAFSTDERNGILQVFRDSRELVATLNSKINLLENIEDYLQDWLWGLTYQNIKMSHEEESDIVRKNALH